MQSTRMLPLNSLPFDGKAVLYVMQRDQRVHDNHALLAAQQEALAENVPLYVLFNWRTIATRSREHYQFIADGLKELSANLKELSIPFVMTEGNGQENILKLTKEIEAGSIYFDFTPLSGPRTLAKQIAKSSNKKTIVVDTHNAIPVWILSDKKEFAAHTIRSKVHKKLESYLVEPAKVQAHPQKAQTLPHSLDWHDVDTFIASIPASGITVDAPSGESAARKHLANFIESRLEHYAVARNDIADDQQSGLSPYLHFGHISSLRVALEVLYAVDQRPLLFEVGKLASPGEIPSKADGMNALLEEMIVRKELADNFCFYSDGYLSLANGPQWAQDSLAEHAHDPREHIYTREQWEQAQTHDQSWNAAQNQLRKTGKIHGYMRMYWAKKMLEWSPSPEIALQDCIYLNDKYSIDGGDPNGYVGILWSMVGLHDRPWFERPVFGKVRYMNEGGLMRKYDVPLYQKTWNG